MDRSIERLFYLNEFIWTLAVRIVCFPIRIFERFIWTLAVRIVCFSLRIEKIFETGPNGLVKLRYQDESKANVRSSDLVEAQGYVVQAMGSVSKAFFLAISRFGNPRFV